MEDFELVTCPRKKACIKLELIDAPRFDSSFLEKYKAWNEYNSTTWGAAGANRTTWGEMSLKQHTGEDMPTVIQELEGDAVSMKMTVDSTSDIRKVVNLSLHLREDIYEESGFHELWLNNLVRLSVGLYDWDTGAWHYFRIGLFIVSDSNYAYSAEEETLELSLSDLMCSITEGRGNQIGAEVTIEANESEGSLKGALESFAAQYFPYNFTSYDSYFSKLEIPYDLEFERGITPYEVAKKIVELYPGYEHFYRYVETPSVPVNVFKEEYVVQKIPSRVDDPIIMTAGQMKELVISETGKANPGSVKNVTEVIGQEIEADYADYSATVCTTKPDGTGKLYELTLDEELERYTNGMIVGFTADSTCVAGQRIAFKPSGKTALNPVAIMVLSGAGVLRVITAGEILSGIHYIGTYQNGYFILEGPSLIHAMAMLFNTMPSASRIEELKKYYNCNDIRFMIDANNRFSVEKIGEYVQVFSGGDYENIYTTELAKERAYYENWRSARLTDTLQIKMLYVPWLEVNQKVSYESIATGETNTYLIQSFTVNISDFTMDVTMNKFFPYYPEDRSGHLWSEYANQTWGAQADLTWDEMGYDDEE